MGMSDISGFGSPNSVIQKSTMTREELKLKAHLVTFRNNRKKAAETGEPFPGQHT